MVVWLNDSPAGAAAPPPVLGPIPERGIETPGRSQPRPRRPDRHRRSGDRHTTARRPAKCGTGGAPIVRADSVHMDPDVPCTLTDRHRPRRLGTEGRGGGSADAGG